MHSATLTQLARLLPSRSLHWKFAAHHRAQLHPSLSYSLQNKVCVSQSQRIAASSTLTDVYPQPEQPTHKVYGDPRDLAGQEEVEEAPVSKQASDKGRTGAFQKIPMVSPAKELLESALRRAARVGPNKKLKNEAHKARNRAARQLDTLLKELCVPLGRYVKEFPPPSRLHPFECALLDLTVGPGTYQKVLARVDAVRRSTVQVGKAYAARCSKAVNKKEAIALQEEGFERVEAVFTKGAAAVDELKEVAKSLRKLPVVDPELPTVALVGAPNVGKSSLVQLLSSGLPEVQNYPFTTRSIKMGHFYVDGRRHQVTDTPGLLDRGDEDRNAMERLTLASLQYLPTAVLFVADLTGECGTSVADQWSIREDLRAKFPGKPWIDVFSKTDMLEEEFDAADDLAARWGQQGSTATSPESGSNHDYGRASISSAEGSVGAAHASAPGEVQNSPSLTPSSQFSGSASAPQPVAPSSHTVSTAVEFAVALPAALGVSSLTGDGIETLKGRMLSMIEEGQLVREGVEGWWGEEEEEPAGEDGGLIFHEDEDHREHGEYMYD